jgi:DNA-binding transcriptional regulator YhcF (GntR family)
MSIQDTASGVALWRQVADGIERGIADGRFVAGEKLPGEMEIAETYRVNRHTVRRALATLAERGLVRAERGSGTYVEAQRLAYPLRARTRFSEIVGAGGLMSYGASLPDLFRRGAAYAHKILQGIKPADLPIEQPKRRATPLPRACVVVGLAQLTDAQKHLNRRLLG